MIWFSVESPVKVSAETVPSGGRFLTTQEALQFIGSSIPVTYYDGSGYSQTTATYDGVVTCENEVSENPVGYVLSPDGVASTQYLHYTIPAVGANNNNSYVTFNLQPTYSLFDTSMVYTCFALSYSISGLASYQSPQANFYIGGSIHHYENQSLQNSGSSARARLVFGSGTQIKNCTYVPISFSSQSTFSAYAVDCSFYGNGGSGVRHFYIMIPYVSNNASGASGTFDTSGGQTGGSTGSGDINVNVDVDMTETNGLLGRIEIILSGIVDDIKGLFIPDDEFLSDWVDDMKDLLEDHLGGLYQAVTLLDTFWDQFQLVTAKQAIDIPACSVPLAGSTFTLGPYSVPLKVSGLPSVLYDGIAYIIDFLAVMAFIKMCRNKLEIFLNPDSEVVQNDN